VDFALPAFSLPCREKYGMMGLAAVKETGKSEVGEVIARYDRT